jgi:multiple sugar transport system substrate-binding protein
MVVFGSHKEDEMKKLLGIIVMTMIVLMGCSKGAPAKKVQVRWFVGLGAGSDEPTFAPQKAVVEKFNASQNEIELVLEIVDNTQAYNTLATQISGGNGPDIVGPVGIRGRDSFKGSWLDLAPLVEKTKYDLTQFDASMVDFYRNPTDGLIGLPFAIYPSYLYVNKALFAEAGIPLPPKKYGAPYVDENGKEFPWDYDTVKMIAKKLTVDAKGIDATNGKFDNTKIVQWGFGQQWGDARSWGTLFGPGTFVADDGKAQIPANWLESWNWIYDGMWKSHFIPNGPYGSSDILGGGDWFASGKIGMDHSHLWYAGFAKMNFDWDIYPMPAYKGKTTAKMHADTFVITKGTKHPEASFKVLSYLLGDGSNDLLTIYGGMPARKSLQANFLANFFKTKFPERTIDAQIVVDSIAYADNPNHESWMPSFQETTTRYSEFWNILTQEPNANINDEAAKLKKDLDQIFAAAKK